MRARTKNNSAKGIASTFLALGIGLLAFAMIFNQQIAAFIGLGLTFWGAVFLVTRTGTFVDGSLLDSSARSSYTTLDRMITDLKYNGQSYYIPAYPQDVALPDYLKNLKEPVTFISESFDGKPSLDELAQGKFISTRSHGLFITSPGAGILTQIERQLQLDLSKINLTELTEILPKILTENLSLAKNADLVLTSNGAHFKASSIVYNSLYDPESRPKSVSLLGCPVVSAVASALAKTSGKTVIIQEQIPSAGNSVYASYVFVR